MDMADKPREVVIHQSATVRICCWAVIANWCSSRYGCRRARIQPGVMVGNRLGCRSLDRLDGALQRMGKADPLLRHVYLRHIRYLAFYPAKSGLHGQS